MINGVVKHLFKIYKIPSVELALTPVALIYKSVARVVRGIKTYRYKYKKLHSNEKLKAPVLISLNTTPYSTLSGKKHQMLAETRTGFKTFVKSGGVLMFNTAGNIKGAKEVARELNSSMVVSAFNGAFISTYNPDGTRTILKNSTLPANCVTAVHEALKLHDSLCRGAALTIESMDGNTYMTPVDTLSSREALRAVKAINDPAAFNSAKTDSHGVKVVDLRKVTPMAKDNKHPPTIEAGRELQQRDFLAKVAYALAKAPDSLKQQYWDKIEINISHNGVNIVPKGCSKLQAVKEVSNALGIEQEATVVQTHGIGDLSYNISMDQLKDFFDNCGEQARIADKLLVADPENFYFKHPENLQMSFYPGGYLNRIVLNEQFVKKVKSNQKISARQKINRESLKKAHMAYNECKQETDPLISQRDAILNGPNPDSDENKNLVNTLEREIKALEMKRDREIDEYRQKLEKQEKAKADKIDFNSYRTVGILDVLGRANKIAKDFAAAHTPPAPVSTI